MIKIAKETPHMFMWFSDGSKIPEDLSPLPQNARLNYIQRLKEECAKLLPTKTPVYLVYLGRLLTKKQKMLLEALQNDIPNLAVIDYDDVEHHISDKTIIDKVATYADAYKQNEKQHVGLGGIADLVDFTRLILLYNSSILRTIAQRKIKIALAWRQGLIYRDLDVTLEQRSMPDIPTTHGYMATLNLLGEARKYHKDLLISAKDNNKLQEKITAFFNTQIYNPERYQQILALFLKKELNTEEAQAKQAVISEYKELHTEQHLSFEWNFITTIRIENSFLAVNTDQNPLVDAIIKDIQRTDCSPYGAVQKHFTKPFRQKSFLNEYLTPQRLGFNIGNDLTWQMGIEQQHLLTVSTNPSSPTVTNNPRHALSKELREYYPHYRPANQKQKRYHFYQASSPRYSDLKGDALKSHVLLKFKNKLEACANLKNLQTEIANIKKSNDYEILIKGQGIVTRLFHLRTSAAIAFEEMSHELTAQHQHTEIHEKGTSP